MTTRVAEAARAVVANAPSSGPRFHKAVADLVQLSRSLPVDGGQNGGIQVAETLNSLAQQLRIESSSFRSTDIVLIIGACCRLAHCHPPLLEAAAAHVIHGMTAYPLSALCNVPNGFARLTHRHEQLLDAIAGFLADSTHVERLSPVDIGSLINAYARFSHAPGSLLNLCTQRLKTLHLEVGGQNCAGILNSYAKLSECNPALFHLLAGSVLQKKPESFDVHHISTIMTAFAKCQIRIPRLMRKLRRYLESRIQLLSPQNIANVVHACAKLTVHSLPLLQSLQDRLVSEDLSTYKLFELTMLTQGLAKLRCRESNTYKVVFDELVCRREWEPQAVAQILDVMRREPAHQQDTLTCVLLEHFLRELNSYSFTALIQVAWCISELEISENASLMHDELLALDDAETPSRCIMRLVLERMKQLHDEKPFTPSQRCYAQNLVRAYHYKHELDYRLQSHRIRAFCRSLFDVPNSLVSSVARQHRR